MSVFKEFPGLENLEKIQGLSRTHNSPVKFSHKTLQSKTILKLQHIRQITEKLGPVS